MWRRHGLVVLALGCLLAVTACTPPGLPDPITPSGPSAVPGAPPPAGTVVVGLDGTNGRITGFNPYAIADFSPAAQAVASLVLPSTFVMTSGGTLIPDGDVIDEAAVTSDEPFTVTYTLDRAASWSDGTPVTAEDFSYLWAQMLVQPGTVDPAGYQLIDAVRSRNAGKTVEVEFSAPFPDWRTLFSPLLPSHLIKDFPGGWSAALSNDVPLSANRYRMTSYDPVTGQITLARNDKYWATQPQPAAVVLRLGDPPDLLDAFQRGDVQALWFAPDGTMAKELQQAVPAARRVVIPQPATVQLIFNTTSGPAANSDVRTAIAAGINQQAVAIDVTDGWLAGGERVSSQVLLPSQQPTRAAPPEVTTADPGAARAALAAAGYTTAGLYAAKDGQVLRLSLSYPSGNPRLAEASRTIQRELGTIGIEIQLVPDAAETLIDTRLATGAFDLALISVPRTVADPAAAASAFGCPASSSLGLGAATSPPSTRTGDSTPTVRPPTQQTGSATSTDSVTAASPGEATPPRPTPEAAEEPVLPRTGNLSGYCDRATQQVIAAAISGDGSVEAADPGLWTDLPVLPLLQTSTMFAVADSLQTVVPKNSSGWTWTGPLSDLARWPVG